MKVEITKQARQKMCQATFLKSLNPKTRDMIFFFWGGGGANSLIIHEEKFDNSSSGSTIRVDKPFEILFIIKILTSEIVLKPKNFF